MLGRLDEAMRLRQEVYSGHFDILGKEHALTLIAASNYAVSLRQLDRSEEAKALLRETIPVARRVLGENNETVLRMRFTYARTLYQDTGATLGDLSEAETMLEETERIARRVLGGAHPLTEAIEESLRRARAALHAHGDVSSICERVGAMTT